MNSDNNALIDAVSTPKPLLSALYKILQPIARLAIHFGITFPQLSELMKRAYIYVGDNEFKLPQKAQTDTRLSLLTGIHRRDVKRLRLENGESPDVPDAVSTGARLVAQWIGDPSYIDENGKPKRLPLKAGIGENSFETLVESTFKKDLRPRVILDEWLNLGIVSLCGRKHVELNTEAFIPTKGLNEKAFFLGHNVSDHLSAGISNLVGNTPAFFERCIYYDGLSESSIKQLEEAAAKKGMETILEINEMAMRLKAQDIAEGTFPNRINIGLYIFHESRDTKDV